MATTTARRKTPEEVAEAENQPDGSKSSSEARDPIDVAAEIFQEAAEKDPTPDKERKGTRRRRTASREKKSSSIPGSGRKKDLTKDLTGAFGSIAIPMFALSARNPKLAYDAQVILENAEDMATALNDLAQRNPQIYRALFYFTNASDFSAVATIGMNMAIPILVNHGKLPAQTLAAASVSKPPPWMIEQQRNAQQHEPFRPTVMSRDDGNENPQANGG